MKTIITGALVVLFNTMSIAQNFEGPSYEQQAEWRREAHEAGQKTMVTSTVKNFFKHKIIFIVIGGAIALIGGAAMSTNKNEE